MLPGGTKPLPEPMMTHMYVMRPQWLTHWGWDKMTTILQMTFSINFSEWKLVCFDTNLNEISSQGPIDKKSALVQMMGWHWTGNKPLSEPMLTQYLDIFISRKTLINSSAPGSFEWKFQISNFQGKLIDGRGIACEIALRWLSLDLTYDQSTLVRVMARCRQAASHYLNQYWLSEPILTLTLCGINRGQWVNATYSMEYMCCFYKKKIMFIMYGNVPISNPLSKLWKFSCDVSVMTVPSNF